MSRGSSLLAISPIDGRYKETTAQLQEFFSEYALFKYRLFIELEYLLFLSEIKVVRRLSLSEKKTIKKIQNGFSLEDAVRVKDIERQVRHDVKAVEYFLREKFPSSLADLLPWIHFGLTSADINDNAYRMMIIGGLKKVIIPEIKSLTGFLEDISKKFKALPMLGRTHGQPAVPTTFGKEVAVFSERIKRETKTLANLNLFGKFGGAVGNWNALLIAYPGKDWLKLSERFLKKLGLKQSRLTTQSAPPEDIISVFQTLYRLNSALIDFDQDIWRYISDDWIKQKGKEKDVGSSTMPQKVNPIEFENSEGNLTMANGIFESLAKKLPISRLQRDLSDSTVMRNIGLALSYCLIAYKSCGKGIESISPNSKQIFTDLEKDWSILTEALQTLLRKEGQSDAYEEVAKKVRGKKLSQKDWKKLVNQTPLGKSSKKKLTKLTPKTYLGLAKKLVD